MVFLHSVLKGGTKCPLVREISLQCLRKRLWLQDRADDSSEHAHGSGVTQCEMCAKAFPGMDDLYRHTRLPCKGQVEATYPVCGQTFPRKEYLEKHMKIHSVGKTKTFSNEEKVEAVALAK